VAESLGEAFIEVLADTSPFGDSLSSGIADAMSDVQSEVESALGEIPDVADSAFSEAAAAAADAGDQMSAEFSDASAEMQQSLDSVDGSGLADRISENLGAITVGGAVAGAALEGFARAQRDTRVDARNLAAALDLDADAMMRLSSSTSNATFPLEDVVALMRTAAQRGLEGGDALVDFANFWDAIGDATGESGVALGAASVALGQVGIDAGNEAKALDAFGFIMNNTGMRVGDFLKFIEKAGPDLNDLGLDIDQTAGLLSAMERELNLSAKMARGEFNKAVAESDGDLGVLLETLGLSEETLADYTAAVEGSGGAISDNADRFAAARTPIENATAAIEAQMFAMPALAEAASFLSAPLAAIGPAAMGFTHGLSAITSIRGGFTKALGAMRGAFVKLGAAILANPIFLIAALVIGIAIVLYKFRDEIIDALVGAWEFVKEKLGALIDWFKNVIPDAIAAVIDFVKDNWPLILAIITGPIGLAVKFIVDNWDRIKETISNAVQAVRDAIRRGFDAIRNFIRTSIDRIRNFVVDGFNTLRDRATSAVERLRDGVRDVINNVVDFVKDLPARIVRGLGNLGGLLVDKGREMIQGFLDGATNLLKNIGRFLLDRIPGWIRTPFERALGISSPSKVFAEIGRDTIAGFAQGIEDEIGGVERLMSTLGGEIPMSVSPSISGGIAGLTGVGGASGAGRSVDVTMNVYNPAPEPASASASREMRKLAAIGVFGD